MKRKQEVGPIVAAPARRGIYPDARPSRSALPPRAIPRRRSGNPLLTLLLTVAAVLAAAIAFSGPIVRAVVR